MLAADHSQESFEKIKHDVLVALELPLELPLEGGVLQDLLVVPQPLHGNPPQLLGVLSSCGEQNMELS